MFQYCNCWTSITTVNKENNPLKGPFQQAFYIFVIVLTICVTCTNMKTIEQKESDFFLTILLLLLLLLYKKII